MTILGSARSAIATCKQISFSWGSATQAEQTCTLTTQQLLAVSHQFAYQARLLEDSDPIHRRCPSLLRGFRASASELM